MMGSQPMNAADVLAPSLAAGPDTIVVARVVRLALAASAAAAIALQTYLGARASPDLIPLNATLFVLAVLSARWTPRLACWLVLLPAYVFPVVILRLMHGYDEALWSVWTSMLLGYIIGREPLGGWALPPSWRLPLGFWGLSVAVSWPIIVWREMDFTVAQLGRQTTTSVTGVGISPAAECVWIAHVAATHLIGILWIDALYREEPPRLDLRVAPWIVGPLLVSVGASAALAIYQMYGHMDTLNADIFASFSRASGAMLDGNAFGMAAALWIAGALAVAATTDRVPVRFVSVTAAGLLLVAAWGSGSQSAFLAATVAGIGVAYGLWRTRTTLNRRRLVWCAAAVGLVAVVALGSNSRLRSVAIGPIARFELVVEAATSHRRLGLLTTMWTRDRYGTAATAMIRQYPVTGVGVGMFNSFVIDETMLLGLGVQAPDNAQNWFRHQLAEMGLMGCLGWLVWLVAFVPTLWKRPAPGSSLVATYALRGALVGVGLASQVAMPTQNTAVLVTFWTFIFWHGHLVDRSSDASAVRAFGRWGWFAACVLLLMYAAAVWRVGATTLRVPNRAAAAGWPYAYGFYDLERNPSGGAYRWTGQHAVAVFVTPGRDGYIPLTFWAHHPDMREHPVHVRIWIHGRLAVDTLLPDSQPVSRDVHVRADERAVMVEIGVDRTWRPSDSGEHDARALGVAVSDWVFACCLPPGAIVVN
jgi:hypothetical protein